MPIAKIYKRKIILDEACSKVLKIFTQVLSEYGLSIEKDSFALSSVNTSEKTPVSGNLIDKGKQLVESTFSGVFLGGHEQNLPECKADMDAGGYALFTTYRNYWVSLMRRDEKFTAQQLTSEEIKEPYILIMEFHLRLAMQALRLDSPLSSDQKRPLFIQILSKFNVKLSENFVVEGKFHAILFAQHKEWLTTLVDTSEQIEKMNKAKPILTENLAYLEELEKNIIRHLIVLLSDKSSEGFFVSKQEWAGKLRDTQLNETLQEVEGKILARVKKENFSENELSNGMCLVAYPTQNTRQNQVMSCSEMDLVDYKVITQQNAQRQKMIIVSSKLPAVKHIYALLNKKEIIYKFLGQVEALVRSMGLLPLLFHIVELEQIDRLIAELTDLCKLTFESFGLRAKEGFFSTSLGKEFGECTHADVVRNSLPKLGTLQNPQFLEKVFQEMGIDFDRLEKLGTLSGCAVLCNPFKQNTHVRHMLITKTADLEGSSSKLSTSVQSIPLLVENNTKQLGPNSPKRRLIQKEAEGKFEMTDFAQSNGNEGWNDELSSSVMSFPPTTTSEPTSMTTNTHVTAELYRPGNDEAQTLLSSSHDIVIQPKFTPVYTGYIQLFFEEYEDIDFTNMLLEVENLYLEKQRAMGCKDKKINGSPKNSETLADFLDLFRQDGVFAAAGEFCQAVRKVVQTFEAQQMESKKPEDFLSKKLDWDMLWESRHRELFYLKYLCVKVAKTEVDERDLKEFVEKIIAKTKTKFGSDYNDFKDNLQDLMKKRIKLRKCLRLKPEAQQATEIVQLKTEKTKQAIENTQLKDQVTELKDEMEKQELKFDKRLTEMSEENNRRHEETLQILKKMQGNKDGYSSILMYSEELPKIREKNVLYLLKTNQGTIEVYPFFNTSEFKTLDPEASQKLYGIKDLPQFPENKRNEFVEISNIICPDLVNQITSICGYTKKDNLIYQSVLSGQYTNTTASKTELRRQTTQNAPEIRFVCTLL